MYEKLELKNYPFDIQRLNISIVSTLPSSECFLTRDTDKMNDVLIENFRDSQEWHLYRYVGVEDNKVFYSAFQPEDSDHSTINFYCAAARKPLYFVVNAFLLIFIISALSFNVFSIPITTIGLRINSQTTLILTLVSFKWVINRSLPPIAYLTTLDVYSIFAICFMALLDSWHGFIGVYNTKVSNHADSTFLAVAAAIFIAFHVIFFIWFYVAVIRKRHFYHFLQKKFKNQLRLHSTVDKTLVKLFRTEKR